MGKSAAQILTFFDEIEVPSSGTFPEEEKAVASLQELNFGLYLKRERILRGITRGEIVHVTKVRPEYLEALETNQFDQLPPTAFIVGFLRVMSRYVGLNSDEVVNRFLTELAQQEAYERTSVGVLESRRGKTLRFLLWALAITAVLALMFAPLFRQ